MTWQPLRYAEAEEDLVDWFLDARPAEHVLDLLSPPPGYAHGHGIIAQRVRFTDRTAPRTVVFYYAPDQRPACFKAQDDDEPEVYGYGRTLDEAVAFYRLSARLHGLTTDGGVSEWDRHWVFMASR